MFILLIYNYLSTLVPDHFTCCAAMALICPSSDTTAATRLRSEPRSERSRAAGTWQLQADAVQMLPWSCWFSSSSANISRLLPQPPQHEHSAQHLDLLLPAHCKRTHLLRTKSVWMHILPTCGTVGVIFMFYIALWHHWILELWQSMLVGCSFCHSPKWPHPDWPKPHSTLPFSIRDPAALKLLSEEIDVEMMGRWIRVDSTAARTAAKFPEGLL